MIKVKPLINRCVPYADESAYSLLHRLAKRNYYKNIYRLFNKELPTNSRTSFSYSDENTSWTGTIFNFLKYEALIKDIDSLFLNKFNSKIFKEEPTVIERAAFYVALKGRYCPECMSECFYYRQIWDISFVTVCIKHKNFLIDTCGNCGKSLTIFNIMSSVCLCGNRLDRHQPNKNVPNNLLEAQATFKDLLLNREKEVQVNRKYSLSVNEYFYFFRMFGSIVENLPYSIFPEIGLMLKGERLQYLANGKTSHRDIYLLSFTFYLIHELIINPFEMLRYVISYLDGVQRRYKHRRSKRYRIFKEITISPKGELYLDAYNQSVNVKQQVKFNEFRRQLKLPKEEKVYISFNEAVALLGVGPKTLNKLMEGEHKIFTVLKEERRNLSLLIKSEILDYKSKRDGSLSLTKFLDELGMKRTNGKKLIQRGLIKPFQGPDIDGNRYYIISKKEVEKFFDEVFGNAKIIEQVGGNFISFNKAILKFNRYGIGPIDMLELIKDNKMNAYLMGSNRNVRQLYLSIREVEEIIAVAKDN
ncbi:TniQ family protein [Peribacillus butanolivorans]|uniref:TniQ family protein n=1 Tax=Peribacillus butanolivorans TaxID=421767 RepID=UPI0036900C46